MLGVSWQWGDWVPGGAGSTVGPQSHTFGIMAQKKLKTTELAEVQFRSWMFLPPGTEMLWRAKARLLISPACASMQLHCQMPGGSPRLTPELEWAEIVPVSTAHTVTGSLLEVALAQTLCGLTQTRHICANLAKWFSPFQQGWFCLLPYGAYFTNNWFQTCRVGWAEAQGEKERERLSLPPMLVGILDFAVFTRTLVLSGQVATQPELSAICSFCCLS